MHPARAAANPIRRSACASSNTPPSEVNRPQRRPCLPESDGPSFKSALRPLGIFPFGRTLRGLGTSNVQALAKQLRARIKVEDAEPGSAVSVVHTHLAAVNDEAGDLSAEVAI